MTTPKSTSQAKKQIEETFDNTVEYLEDKAYENYDKALDRLKYEKDRLENELRHDYRSARRYVRANPERGIGIAFLSGLLVGVLLTRGRGD
ncbi:MAG: hypothetical protein WC967_06835 [Balneolaceae bacterium]